MTIHTVVSGFSTMTVGLFLDALLTGGIGVLTILAIGLGGWIVYSGYRDKSAHARTKRSDPHQ